jgi:lipopolysaccharide heptosyltransferase II
LIVDRSIVHRILVIKLGGVGDVLLSTIVTKNLRLAFPDAKIHFLASSACVDILKGSPFLDGIVVFDRSKMSGLELIRRVRQGGYDLVIDLFGNPRTALVTRLSKARYRVGFRFRGRTYAYNVVVDPRGGEVHNTQFNLDAIEAIGVAIQDRNIYFHVSPADERYVSNILHEAKLGSSFVVGLNVGGGWYTKRWGLERFAELADRLIEVYDASVVLLWGADQLSDVNMVRSLMKHNVFIPPSTTLPQLAALMRKCSVVVSNDSGPMHLASAVGTPVLGIYGPTNPQLQGPYGNQHLVVRNEGLECIGCNFTKCPIGHPCMRELSVDAVFGAFERLMKQNKVTA